MLKAQVSLSFASSLFASSPTVCGRHEWTETLKCNQIFWQKMRECNQKNALQRLKCTEILVKSCKVHQNAVKHSNATKKIHWNTYKVMQSSPKYTETLKCNQKNAVQIRCKVMQSSPTCIAQMFNAHKNSAMQYVLNFNVS